MIKAITPTEIYYANSYTNTLYNSAGTQIIHGFLRIVQAYLGHAMFKMTMELYTSVMPKHKLSEMDKMSSELERIAQLGDEIAER